MLACINMLFLRHVHVYWQQPRRRQSLIRVSHQIASFKTMLHSLAAAVADPSPLMSFTIGSNH